MTAQLFEPFTVGTLTLPNRLAVPAMVTRLAGEDGYVNDDIVERYSRFAEGGVGLIVVEATSVHGAKSGPLLRASGDEFIPGLSELADACHAAGPGKVVLQIIHFLKIARSGWRQKVADLDIGELQALPDQFAEAAVRARDAGFDGVELHMAHAYTLSSMLSRMNKRRDDYGRTLENRMRLPSQVLARVKETVGTFIVGVRFDADESIRRGYSVDDASAFAVRFADLGADYVSLSAGGKFEDAIHREGDPLYPYTGYSGDRAMPGDAYPDAANSWMSRHVRSSLRDAGHQTPVLGSGKIGSVELAERVLADGDCDIVGMARALLADPWLPAKHQGAKGDETVRCIYCNVCKSLDENFKTVRCYLWPEGTIQAPRPDDAPPPPRWPTNALLTVSATVGEIRLRWPAAGETATGYDLLRSTDGGDYERVVSCTRTRHLDQTAVAGPTYRYLVVPYDAAGRRGPASPTVEAAIQPAHS